MQRNLSKDVTHRARMFVALELPGTVRERLVDAQRHYDDLRPILRLVAPESLHVTVQFLGDVDVRRTASIKTALQETTNSVRPFRLTLSEAGTFAGRGPRVVWMGLQKDEGYESLRELHRSLEPRLALLGFEPERRPFAPHVTFARVRERADSSALQAISTLIHSVKQSNLSYGSFDVVTVSLMRSDPAPAGVRYSALARIPLPSAYAGEGGDIVH